MINNNLKLKLQVVEYYSATGDTLKSIALRFNISEPMVSGIISEIMFGKKRIYHRKRKK